MVFTGKISVNHLPTLRSLLAEWEKNAPPPTDFQTPLNDRHDIRKEGEEIPGAAGKDIIVAFRTRPPLENEAAEKFAGVIEEKDNGEAPSGPVEFCSGISIPSAEPGEFVAHVPGIKWSGLTMANKSYYSDLAFGPHVDNDEVYKRTVVMTDLLPLVLSGGVGCILAYGQTGSGKTFTMEGLEHRIACDLFDVGNDVGKKLLASERGEEVPTVDGNETFEYSVTFIELLGKKAVDLIEIPTNFDEDGNPVRTAIAVQEDKTGRVAPRLISTVVTSSSQLEELITKSLTHRRVSPTLRNANSSRSHALLTIRVKNKLMPYAEEGQLILVDLAGSERYEDSKEHSKQRMDESRENNKSLMNLKDCVRAKAKMASEDGFVHIPWRMSTLTMLMKPIFDIESRQMSRTIIIAHVSPHIQDTVHSTNTLSYASPFKTGPPKRRGPAKYDPKDPRTWNHQQTTEWLTAEFTNSVRHREKSHWQLKAKESEKKGEKPLPFDDEAPISIPVDISQICPDGMTAVNLGRMYTTDFVQKCLHAIPGGEDQPKRGKIETERVKVLAAEVIGKLFYLILSAKTKARNEIMKSRKVLSIEETYGEAPRKEVILDYERLPEGDLIDAHSEIGEDIWKKTVVAAIEKARKEGTDVNKAIDVANLRLMDEWRARKAQRLADENKE